MRNKVNFPATASAALGIMAILIGIIGMLDSNVVAVIASIPVALVSVSFAILSYRADT